MATGKTTNKQYKILVKTGKAENNQTIEIAQGAGDRGQTVRIKAQAGVKYQLQEVGQDKNVAPQYVKVKRVGKDLHIIFEDDSAADLIIEDYYSVMTEGYNGVTGTISFDAKGDIKNGALTLYTYRAGAHEQIAVVR